MNTDAKRYYLTLLGDTAWQISSGTIKSSPVIVRQAAPISRPAAPSRSVRSRIFRPVWTPPASFRSSIILKAGIWVHATLQKSRGWRHRFSPATAPAPPRLMGSSSRPSRRPSSSTKAATPRAAPPSCSMPSGAANGRASASWTFPPPSGCASSLPSLPGFSSCATRTAPGRCAACGPSKAVSWRRRLEFQLP